MKRCEEFEIPREPNCIKIRVHLTICSQKMQGGFVPGGPRLMRVDGAHHGGDYESFGM